MFGSIAQCARKALSLRKDMVFRLLILMTVLLGWLAGLGAGGLMGLENMYKQWHLEQESKVNVYLMADADEDVLNKFTAEAKNVVGVEVVDRLDRNATMSLLKPYFEGGEDFPLPIILDVTVNDHLKRSEFDKAVYTHFPEAEIDDARELLTSVSQGVRFAQWVTVAFSAVIFVIVGLIVSLTVRAGLRGQMQSLAVMQYVGATDGFITRLVVRQVVNQSLVGWLVASILAVGSLFAMTAYHDALNGYLDAAVFAGAIFAPFVLVLLSGITAWLTSYSVIVKARKSV